MIEAKVINAQIVDTMLGFEDRGIMTCSLFLDRSDGGTQGWGGYALDAWSKDKEKRVVESRFGLTLIHSILNVVGVSTWENLKGKYVRIKVPLSGCGKIEALGNLMTEEWINIDELIRECQMDNNK